MIEKILSVPLWTKTLDLTPAAVTDATVNLPTQTGVRVFASIAMTASGTGVNISVKDNKFTGMAGFVGSRILSYTRMGSQGIETIELPAELDQNRIEVRRCVSVSFRVFAGLGEIQAVGLVFLYEPPAALLGLTVKQAVTVFDGARHVRYRHTSHGMRRSDLPSPGRQRTDALARCARLFDEPRASFVAKSSRAVRVKRAGPTPANGALDRGRVEPGLVLPPLPRVY